MRRFVCRKGVAGWGEALLGLRLGGGGGLGWGGGWGGGGGRGGGNDLRQLDLVDFGEFGGEVGVTLVGDQILVGGFAVAGIDFVDHVHAFEDGAEGGEAHAVEAGVVAVVDEELGGAGAGAGGGEDEGSAGVALLDGVVVDVGVGPDLVDGGVGVETELDDEAGDDAEEGGVGEVAAAHEVVKAVGAEGSPVAVDFDHEVAGRGGESGFEDGGSRGVERGGNEQRGLGRGDCGVRGAGFGRRAAVGSGSLGGGEQARAQDDSGKEGFHDDRLYGSCVLTVHGERLKAREVPAVRNAS